MAEGIGPPAATTGVWSPKMNCGELARSPSIFEKAVADSHYYDEDIWAIVQGEGAEAMYEALGQHDVQGAAGGARSLIQSVCRDASRPQVGAKAVPQQQPGIASGPTLKETINPRTGLRSRVYSLLPTEIKGYWIFP